MNKPERGESCMRLRPSSCAASCRAQSYQWHMVALASLAVTALVMWYFSGFGAACYRPPLDKPELAASFVRLCGRAVAFQPAKLTVRDQSISAKTFLNLPPRSTPKPRPPPTTSVGPRAIKMKDRVPAVGDVVVTTSSAPHHPRFEGSAF